MRHKEKTIDELEKFLAKTDLNDHQKKVLTRLIECSKRNTERQLAEYLNTMEDAAVFWAINYESLLHVVSG